MADLLIQVKCMANAVFTEPRLFSNKSLVHTAFCLTLDKDCVTLTRLAVIKAFGPTKLYCNCGVSIRDHNIVTP